MQEEKKKKKGKIRSKNIVYMSIVTQKESRKWKRDEGNYIKLKEEEEEIHKKGKKRNIEREKVDEKGRIWVENG